jgi:oligopeptide transport system permease protein
MQMRNRAPDAEYWFGTNSIGQDLWARIWSGTRTSLLIGIIVGIIEMVVGIIYGALWGYVRRLDHALTEVYNVLNNIPTTIILLLMAYILRPGFRTMIIAMCVTGWLGLARFVRNQIVIIRDREYNLASRCLGTSTWRIITHNLLPYLVSVIMLQMALSIPSTIGWEVFLTYIGLGLPVSIPSLGNLVNEGRLIMMSPELRYQLIFPTIVLSIITISFYLLGNAFADASDPRNHV